MVRSLMAVDAQLAVGLGSTPISSFSCLPSRWLRGRPCKAPPYGEPHYSNHMVSDVMNHSIRFLYCCLLRWDLGSKFSAAPNISSYCFSSQLPDCRQILRYLLYLCCWLLFLYYCFLLLCCFLCCCLYRLHGRIRDYDVYHFCHPRCRVLGFVV